MKNYLCVLSNGNVIMESADTFTDVLKELYLLYKGVLTTQEFDLIIDSKETEKDAILFYNKLMDINHELDNVVEIKEELFSLQDKEETNY